MAKPARTWCLCEMLMKARKAQSTTKTLTNFCLYSFFLLLSITTADDSIAMLKLANSLSPTPANWSRKDPSGYCSWLGITCNPTTKRVISINLCNQSLSGTLPSEFSTLSHLKTLHLAHNYLSGALPSFANLTHLQEVHIDSNNFSSIPPGFFQGLILLEFFIMDSNTNLVPWSIPKDLGQCISLITFDARRTNLKGKIPNIFASLTSLQHLYLSFNNLTGVLPASFRNSGIQVLKLNDLGLSGDISVLSSMTRLENVRLHKNKFTGPIPDLSECENLYDLELKENQFTGIVPASLISHPRLQRVSISNNKLQGPIPDFPSRITVYNEGKNHFCSHVPKTNCAPQVTIMLEIAGALGYPAILSDSWQDNDACKNWPFITCNKYNRIVTVNLGKHNFTGTISSAFANLTSLRNLYLNDNNLVASIPLSLTKLTSLRVLDVSNNNLNGTIPDFACSVKLITTPGNPLLHKSKHSNLRPP